MSPWVRGSALALASVGLAAAAHASAGGTTPLVAVLLMAVVLAPLLSGLLALSGNLLVVASALVGIQVAAHVWLGGSHAPAGRGPVLDHAGHGAFSGADASASALAHLVSADGLMLALHVTALIATIALWALAGPLLHALLRLMRSPLLPRPVITGARRLRRHHALVVAPGARLHHVVTRRGPPVLA